MRYYPVNLDIHGRQCLVVGAGGVGTRKVKTLRRCGAVVNVVSPEVDPSLERQAAVDQAIILKRRTYRSADVEDMFLVIGATNDEALNRQIHADAEQRGLLCNIADRPEICNFVLPAIVQRGDFVMAISTAGKSPAFAKYIRKQLETQYGSEYGALLDLMGAIRKKLLAEAHEPEVHKPLFEKLIEENLLGLVRDEQITRIDQLLEAVLGPGYRYKELMTSNRSVGE